MKRCRQDAASSDEMERREGAEKLVITRYIIDLCVGVIRTAGAKKLLHFLLLVV